VVKKDRSRILNKTHLMKMIPIFYQAHLESQLKRSQYLILSILINLLQSLKQVNLEALATAFPFPILFSGTGLLMGEAMKSTTCQKFMH
jgi:hypothetical protein